MTGLRLYHRSDCHLCELALALLDELDLADALERFDIDTNLDLGIELGWRIPVLERSDGKQLDWPFDAEAVRAFVV